MPTGLTVSLSQLVTRLSPILTHSDEVILNVDDPVSTFTLYDANDSNPIPKHALVLGIGVVTDEHARALARAGSVATAIIVRESVTADPAIAAALGAEAQLLVLRNEATWSQLVTTLTFVFGFTQPTPDTVAMGDAETDMFTLANSVASLVGGPVTIEDLSFRILAFSSDQAEADEARALSVLGHQVPEAYSTPLHEQGIMRTIYQSPTPVFLDDFGPAIRPRVVMRLQAGGELLGSVWIVIDEHLSEQRQRGLIEAANVIALTMLRIRMTQDSTTRLRTSRILALLDGGSSALETARTARLPLDSLVVLALGLPLHDSDPHAEFELQRLASSLAMHLQSVGPNATVSLLGDVVYAVLPLEPGATTRRAHAIADDFLSRVSGSHGVLIGVGSSVGVRELPTSRQEADRVLRVLRHREGRGPAAATAEDVFIESLLLQMSDLIEDSSDTVSGPLQALIQYDTENKTQLVETLRIWLNRFGDVAAASDELMIHKNTFRYRLKRLSELAGIDLEDPEHRFGLMLQLRLFSV